MQQLKEKLLFLWNVPGLPKAGFHLAMFFGCIALVDYMSPELERVFGNPSPPSHLFPPLHKNWEEWDTEETQDEEDLDEEDDEDEDMDDWLSEVEEDYEDEGNELDELVRVGRR
jgi:hypothetical protein